MFKPYQEYPPMTDTEVDKLYFDAVLYFRRMVEYDGVPPSVALHKTLESCTLGLNQRGDLEDEVTKRYNLKEGI